MQIHALHQGIYTIDSSHKISPYDPQNTNGVQKKIILGITPFLIHDNNDFLLLDTGLSINSAPYSLEYQLGNYGIKPDKIRAILFSHLHHDHIGGSLVGEDLRFPKAVHVMHKKHFEFILANGSEIEKKQVLLLQKKAKVHFLEDEHSGQIYARARYEVTHGHCPYHMSFIFKGSDGHVIFYGGDEAPQVGQMKIRIIAKYDYDGKEADRLRGLWWEEGRKARWTFLFYHDLNSQIFYS